MSIHFSQYYFVLFKVTGLPWIILCDSHLHTALRLTFMEQASTPTPLFSHGDPGRVCDKSDVIPLRLRAGAHSVTELSLGLFDLICRIQNYLVTDIS